jgi:hypothetical protein
MRRLRQVRLIPVYAGTARSAAGTARQIEHWGMRVRQFGSHTMRKSEKKNGNTAPILVQPAASALFKCPTALLAASWL